MGGLIILCDMSEKGQTLPDREVLRSPGQICIEEWASLSDRKTRAEVWISPLGNYKVYNPILDESEYEAREKRRKEWLEGMGIDPSDFQIENNETPEEKSERIAEAITENNKMFDEWGAPPRTEEEQAELDALAVMVGWRKPNEGLSE